MARLLLLGVMAAVLTFAGAGCGDGRLPPAEPPKELIPVQPPPVAGGVGKQPAKDGKQKPAPPSAPIH